MSNTEDSDSDHFQEDDISEKQSKNECSKGMDLTGFLFGNVEPDGKLSQDSALSIDPESGDKLAGLSKLLGGDGSGLLLPEEEGSIMETDEDEFDSAIKDPSAEDYSEITEALSDEDSSSSDSSDDEEKDKSAIVKREESASTTEDEKPLVEKEIKKEVDEELMPPPASVPVRNVATVKQEQKPSIRPLAAMLPDKYKAVDVRELFPEFRPNEVLRFSRLFPIKPSHKPKFWKNVRAKIKEEEEAAIKEELEREERSFGWQFNYAEWPEDASAYEEDGVVRFHKPKEEKDEQKQDGGKEKEKRGPKQTDWRWGPAQYWYDMLGLPEVVEKYDYGLRNEKDNANDDTIKKEPVEEKKSHHEIVTTNGETRIDFPSDAFLMVTQANWEEDVIWNGDDIRHKVLQKLNSKTNAAGWVPTGFNRTAGSFSTTGKTVLPGIKLQTLQHKKPENGDDTFYSIFPVENEELAYGRWEDEIIWDTDSMPVKLEPKMVSLDPNDDNIILGIPEDIDPSTLPSDQPVRKVKIIQKHVKKSRMLLNRSGIISVVEEESPPPPPKMDDLDPFNLSQDEYYMPKAQESFIKVATGGTLLQHATPVVQLQAPFVPTHLGPVKLRQFHRWPLKRFSHGPLANYLHYIGVSPLTKYMKKRARAREAEREEAGGGDIFFMRTPEDISGKDGELVLFEYIEEHPPLLSQVGMASKVKNYHKRLPGSDKPKNTDYKYGELTLAHTSPFLGQMAPGQTIPTLENNLYRSPIYEHNVPQTDFIVIRTRNEYSIREMDALYTVGQECPLFQVPGPNSKKANNFTRDFLKVFIFRLFWKSPDNPKRIKMDEIKRAFPAQSESSIRKRLKPCAQFHRTGHDSNWWVIKPGFRLPTEEEMRALVTPEQCCAFFSMIAAEQRLRDAGYGEKFLLAQPDDEDDDTAMKMEDEVKVAPWNTTHAYIQAGKGKWLLQLTGPADPTGPAKEGFSYVKMPNKPTNKDEQEQQPKRTVTGTDADLRKLPLKDARDILRKNGVPEKDIMRLSRWEVIDVVRTLSTEKVKAGEEGDMRFSRGNRFSIAEHQERYREECQRIFELQNKVLASDEVLSSDDAESSEEEDVNDEDLDEMGKNLESMLSNKKTSSQFIREQEEADRKRLQKDLLEQTSSKKGKRAGEAEEANQPNKFLRITRVFKNPQGKEYTRTELVRKPQVVEAYLKVRQTKDEAFIRQFATPDETTKEEMKKERRRLQEQLRRIKRNEEKERLGQLNPKRRKNARTTPKKSDLNLKCGACGAKGHMRTNKACPKFVDEDEPETMASISVAMTEKEEEEIDSQALELEGTEELVKVDGTKMSVSAKLLKHADEVRKKSTVLKVPKKILKGAKRRRAGTVEHCDYLNTKNYRTVKRRRTDPIVSFASFLENLHAELRGMDEALGFLQPVNTKKLPNYLEKVKTPMDLQTIRENIQKKKYRSKMDFLTDINQIVENSRIYNGEDDFYTKSAERLYQVVTERFMQNDDKLSRLEKAINPLLDDNSMVRLNHVIKTIVETKIQVLPESWPFTKPVNRKTMKNYYDLIKNPMDLETVMSKATSKSYRTRQEFLNDIELIKSNSATFNGADSPFTEKAQTLVDIAKESLDPFDGELAEMEANIREVESKALEDIELDSIATSMGGDEAPPPPKKKRGRPRKTPISQEFVDDEDDDHGRSPKRMKMDHSERSNLADDLQYSSDDEDPDWEAVGSDEDVTVTIDEQSQDAQHPVNIGGFYQEIQAGGQSVQIEAPNIVLQEQTVVEEQVDENYDPTDFLQSLGQPQPEVVQPPVEIVNVGPGAEVVAQGPIDVINDDLDISDSDDDEPPPPESQFPASSSTGQGSDGINQPDVDDKTVVAPPAPSLIPEPPPPDEDGLWF